MAPETMTPQQNYLHMKLRESKEEVNRLKEELDAKNKAAQNPSTIAKTEAVSPMGEENPSSELPDGYFHRLRDYEPGKDMGMDWYTKRIFGLVDEVNRLTCLLDTHKIPHINTRT